MHQTLDTTAIQHIVINDHLSLACYGGHCGVVLMVVVVGVVIVILVVEVVVVVVVVVSVVLLPLDLFVSDGGLGLNNP